MSQPSDVSSPASSPTSSPTSSPATGPWVGIDVSKQWLDVAVRPTGEVWRIANRDSDMPTLVAQLQAHAPQIVVLEATGGYERLAAAWLGEAQVPVVVVNPRQVRDFAKAIGRLAKTDALDAHVLAHFAAAIQPTPRPLPDAQAQHLTALLERRGQLVGMLAAEKTRRQQVADPAVGRLIDTHLSWLKTAIKELNRELDDLLRQSPLWDAREHLLRSVPGVGAVLALTLIAELPELGTLSQKQVAALVGVAPLNRESGLMRGKRLIWGGRARVRKMLYLGTLAALRHNPLLRAFYQRLRERGKPPKVAIVACMHKLLTILNAMLKQQRPWQAPAAA